MRAICDWSQVPLIFDTEYAALLLNTAAFNVRQAARNGNIPAIKQGKRWIFEKESFQNWLKKEGAPQ